MVAGSSSRIEWRGHSSPERSPVILDTLDDAPRYASLHPRFAAAFSFLRQPGIETLAPGRHPIEGETLFAIVSREKGRTRAEARLESHRRYIDIQYVVTGTDEMGWKPTAACARPDGDYNPERDIRFYDDPVEAWVLTPPGRFCIFFPEDAHAPLVSDGAIHKVVVKVALTDR